MSSKCHAFIHNKKVKATGGKKTQAILKTANDWCEYYGVTVKSGVAILYKAVKEDFSSNYSSEVKYTPGSKPKANGFDDHECSLGLHFCPHPKMALEFHRESKRFVACPVKVSEMLVNFEWGSPQKCKAPRVYKACYEVTIDGEKVKK